MNRREFLALTAAPVFAQESKPDATLRIAPVELEIAPGKIVKTVGYNGSAPGPLLRFPEGRPVTIEVHNQTSIPELVHWHGLWIPSNVDGSMEEGTPMIPARGVARYTFTPKPAGTRWYHTHTAAGRNLNRASYTGQFGFFYIHAKEEPGAFDAEVFLALHGWDPYLSTMGEDEGAPLLQRRSSEGRPYWPAMILTGAPSSVSGNATIEPTPLAALSLASVPR